MLLKYIIISVKHYSNCVLSWNMFKLKVRYWKETMLLLGLTYSFCIYKQKGNSKGRAVHFFVFVCFCHGCSESDLLMYNAVLRLLLLISCLNAVWAYLTLWGTWGWKDQQCVPTGDSCHNSRSMRNISKALLSLSLSFSTDRNTIK